MLNAPQPQTHSAAEKTVAEMLGEITWLLTQSPIHKQMFIGDLEWFCMPPIIHRTFRMFYGPQSPAAVALFANVSAETDARLMTGAHKLQPQEWVGGHIGWLVELIAPFGALDEILTDLGGSVFAGRSFKFHRVTPAGQREVAVWEPTITTVN